jgi:hypothetical protein
MASGCFANRRLVVGKSLYELIGRVGVLVVHENRKAVRVGSPLLSRGVVIELMPEHRLPNVIFLTRAIVIDGEAGRGDRQQKKEWSGARYRLDLAHRHQAFP